MDFQDIFESESGVGLQLNQRGHNESISDDENLDLDSQHLKMLVSVMKSQVKMTLFLCLRLMTPMPIQKILTHFS